MFRKIVAFAPITLILFSVGYILAALKWHLDTPLYSFINTICEVVVVLTILTIVLVMATDAARSCVDAFRSIRDDYPRFIYAMRAAKSAWVAWDEPTIAERRKALERRAVVDKHDLERRAAAAEHDLERALMEVAHQQHGPV